MVSLSGDPEQFHFRKVTGLDSATATINYRHERSARTGKSGTPRSATDLDLSFKQGVVRMGSALANWISIHEGQDLERDLLVSAFNDKNLFAKMEDRRRGSPQAHGPVLPCEGR